MSTKVLISARLENDHIKAIAKIAKRLDISKNAVIENALDLYAETILGLEPNNDIKTNIQNDINFDRIQVLELTLSELQANTISTILMISTRLSELEAITKEAKVSAPNATLEPTANIELPHKETPIDEPLVAPSPSIEATQELPIEAIQEQPIVADSEITTQLPPTIATPKPKPEILEKADFKARFKLNDLEYARVDNNAKKLGSYTAKDSSIWKPLGTKANRVWKNTSNHPATLAEV